MGTSLYEDDDVDQELVNWGPPRQKWRNGHAVYRDPALEQSALLYRYVSARNAFSALESRTLWFSSVYQWDDPHEKWWCDLLFRPDSHLTGASPYGSCWTRRYRDEPFWRMYGCECKEDDDGAPKARTPVRILPAVRFRTNAGNLFSWLTDSIGRQPYPCKGYIGSVRYCPVKQMTSQAHEFRTRAANTSLAAARGLLMKRRAFMFEHEVRMLWIDRQTPRLPGRAIPFEPHDLLEQVMIGPTTSDKNDRYDEVFDTLVSLGVKASMIYRSSAYTPPTL